MPFELPPLPYAKDALAPYISANTLDFHHGKHHQTYVTTLNNLTKDTPLASKSLEEVIKDAAGDPSKTGVFNNAAQVWNHTFFWNCMKPGGGGKPTGPVASAIDQALRLVREVRRGVQERLRHPVRQRLGLARRRERHAEGPQDQQCRSAAGSRPAGAADLRRLGARLLSRLPESASRLRAGVSRSSRELGLRRRRTWQAADAATAGPHRVGSPASASRRRRPSRSRSAPPRLRGLPAAAR